MTFLFPKFDVSLDWWEFIFQYLFFSSQEYTGGLVSEPLPIRESFLLFPHRDHHLRNTELPLQNSIDGLHRILVS